MIMSSPRALVVAAGLGIVPILASAQQPPAPPLQIQSIDSGFVIAPDARFTEINDRFATLAGFYGGWLTDQTLLVGGGAYWLANREDDFQAQYFGGIGRWTFGGHRRLGVSVGGLLGFGDATLSRSYGDIFGAEPVAAAATHGARFSHGGGRISANTRFRINEHFFVAEPQVNAVWVVTPWMRLDLGAGYRTIAGADLLGDQLRGLSGSIALQFGGR